MKTVEKTIDSLIKQELEKEFENRMPEIRGLILEEYHMELESAVTDRKSRTNPGLPKYVEAFEKELSNFNMLNIKSAGLVISMPSVDNFDWSSGTLRVIKHVLEGTAGIYVEIDAEQYEQMYGKRPIGLQAFDETGRKKDMVYIIRYTSIVRRKEKEAFGKRELVRYPFSNTPPIDIFKSANSHVEKNIKSWIDDALKRALKRLKTEYRG